MEQIFISCLSEDYLADDQPNPKIAPILLCHICRAWRVTALSTKELWSHLHMKSISILVFLVQRDGNTLEYMNRHIAPKFQDFLDWWTKNIASFPLTLSVGQPVHLRGFYHTDGYEKTNSFHICDIPTMTYTQFFTESILRRARDLDLSLLEGDIAELCKFRSIPFQNLECLRLHTYLDMRGVEPYNLAGFPHSPSLRRLRLSRSKLLLLFPCPQITHLCINSPVPQDTFYQILAETCISLEYGDFSVMRTYEDDEDDVPSPISQLRATRRAGVPTLKHLSLSCESFAVRSPLFGLLFPSLVALRLESTYNNALPSLQRATEMLSAAPNVTELHFNSRLFHSRNPDKGYDFVDAQRLETTLPKLEHLELEVADNISTRSAPSILLLLKSGWFRPISSAAAQLKLSLQAQKSGPFRVGGSADTEVEASMIEEINAFFATNPSGCCFSIQRFPRNRSRRLSNNLRLWDNGMRSNA